jgi:hypothetical protein
MDVAVFLCSKDAASGKQRRFVTFALSKVKHCLRNIIAKSQSKMRPCYFQQLIKKHPRLECFLNL